MIALFCATSVLISFGVIIGKATLSQLIIMATIQVVVQSVNEFIAGNFLQVLRGFSCFFCLFDIQVDLTLNVVCLGVRCGKVDLCACVWRVLWPGRVESSAWKQGNREHERELALSFGHICHDRNPISMDLLGKLISNRFTLLNSIKGFVNFFYLFKNFFLK